MNLLVAAQAISSGPDAGIQAQPCTRAPCKRRTCCRSGGRCAAAPAHPAAAGPAAGHQVPAQPAKRAGPEAPKGAPPLRLLLLVAATAAAADAQERPELPGSPPTQPARLTPLSLPPAAAAGQAARAVRHSQAPCRRPGLQGHAARVQARGRRLPGEEPGSSRARCTCASPWEAVTR